MAQNKPKLGIDWMEIVIKGGIGLIVIMVSIIAFFTSNIYLGVQKNNDLVDTLYSNMKDFRYEMRDVTKGYDAQYKELTQRCHDKSAIDSMQNTKIDALMAAKKHYSGVASNNTAYKFK